MFGLIKFVRHLNWMTLQTTIACVVEKRLTGLSAEMAFHAMLGLFPAIIAFLTAIGLFEKSVESILVSIAIHFADIIPLQAWNLILTFIEEVKLSQSKGWFSLSSVGAIWIISGVLSAAINALDLINQIPRKYKRSFWQTKIVAILLTIATMIFLVIACFLLWIGDFLLQVALDQSWNELLLTTWKIFTVVTILIVVCVTISLVYQIQIKLKKQDKKQSNSTVTGIIVVISGLLIQLIYSLFLFVQGIIINSDIEHTVSLFLLSIWRLLSFPLSLSIIAFAFGFIYRFGTSYWIKGTPIMPGAILAAISWAIVSVLFRFYVSHFGTYHKIYGAVGAIAVLMLWLYLSSFVMLLGAQINAIVGKKINHAAD